jgi:hypothetical protein
MLCPPLATCTPQSRRLGYNSVTLLHMFVASWKRDEQQADAVPSASNLDQMTEDSMARVVVDRQFYKAGATHPSAYEAATPAIPLNPPNTWSNVTRSVDEGDPASVWDTRLCNTLTPLQCMVAS